MELPLFIRMIIVAGSLAFGSYFVWFVWHYISVSKPQFTMRDLLLSTALIAAGTACIVTPIRRFNDDELFFKCIFLLPPGPPLVVAGLMAPFTKAWRGFFVLAIILAVLSSVAYYKQNPPHAGGPSPAPGKIVVTSASIVILSVLHITPVNERLKI
jgi:hypothetical protein